MNSGGDAHDEQVSDLSRERSRSAREDRADFLEEQRVERAQTLAFDEGVRRTLVDSRLAAHDAKFAVINGSIARQAAELARLTDELAIRNAVDADRVAQLKRASDDSLSTRTFLIGVTGVMIMLAGVILSLLVAVHAI